MKSKSSINILLADDDKDDCLLFNEVLAELPVATSLATVNDGEQLMQHLQNVSANLPDILFLDMNMPRKDGFECLTEIKKHSLLQEIPIVIYSTSNDPEIINQLFDKGAHYYICKPADFQELKKAIHRALLLVQENNSKTSEEIFLITPSAALCLGMLPKINGSKRKYKTPVR